MRGCSPWQPPSEHAKWKWEGMRNCPFVLAEEPSSHPACPLHPVAVRALCSCSATASPGSLPGSVHANEETAPQPVPPGRHHLLHHPPASAECRGRGTAALAQSAALQINVCLREMRGGRIWKPSERASMLPEVGRGRSGARRAQTCCSKRARNSGLVQLMGQRWQIQ